MSTSVIQGNSLGAIEALKSYCNQTTNCFSTLERGKVHSIVFQDGKFQTAVIHKREHMENAPQIFKDLTEAFKKAPIEDQEGAAKNLARFGGSFAKSIRACQTTYSQMIIEIKGREHSLKEDSSEIDSPDTCESSLRSSFRAGSPVGKADSVLETQGSSSGPGALERRNQRLQRNAEAKAQEQCKGAFDEEEALSMKLERPLPLSETDRAFLNNIPYIEAYIDGQYYPVPGSDQ